jgi:hypothetical protein
VKLWNLKEVLLPLPNIQSWQEFLQCLGAFGGNPGLESKKLFQAVTFSQNKNSGIRNLSIADIQVYELSESAYRLHSTITDLGLTQSEMLHAAHLFEMGKSGIGNSVASKTENP